MGTLNFRVATLHNFHAIFRRKIKVNTNSHIEYTGKKVKPQASEVQLIINLKYRKQKGICFVSCQICP